MVFSNLIERLTDMAGKETDLVFGKDSGDIHLTLKFHVLDILFDGKKLEIIGDDDQYMCYDTALVTVEEIDEDYFMLRSASNKEEYSFIF